MTKDTMDAQSVIGQTADGGFLRKAIGFAAQWPMKMDQPGLAGDRRGRTRDPTPPDGPRSGVALCEPTCG
ncbi:MULTISPECIES: hypothetical protein [unclassified Novosphingobium]|uniref:hypothetical protein n=1 Tax=unclassified Novosphingobium TaxID=2644732 RepID=UPI00135B2D3B|nr:MULTISPECIES: hypothetical protein [unclassified Novosphingobium]